MKKIPVWKTVKAGYSFTFANLGTIIGLIWLPMVVVAVAGYFVMSQYYRNFPQALEQGNPTAAAQSGLIVLLWSVALLLLSSMMYAAVTRQALGLRHGPAFINFQFGASELRVFGALVALLALLFFFIFVYLVVAGAAAGIATAMGPAAAAGAALVVGILVIVFFFAMIYAMVRLSFLLIPVTVAEGKIGIAHGWQLTKGNFWRICLIGFATLGPVVLLMMAAEIAILGPAFFMPHGPPPADMDAEMRELVAQMRVVAPHLPLLYGFSFFIAPLVMGLGLAPPAFAYKALTSNPADVA